MVAHDYINGRANGSGSERVSMWSSLCTSVQFDVTRLLVWFSQGVLWVHARSGEENVHCMHKYLGPRNSTLFARLFLDGRHAQAWHETKYHVSDLMQQYYSA